MSTTIAAVATAHGIGSISIIRLSGDNALQIAAKITQDKPLKPRYATLSTLHNKNSELIDEAIVIYFRGPNSFTGEDIVEFQCHGGVIVAEQVLDSCLSFGAELAQPGEFSKRAFFNGRIDLSEAEAIAQLIESKSEDAAKILAAQMKGSLKNYVEDVRNQLIEILAYSEVSIDYAEEDLPQDIIDQIILRLNVIKGELNKTLQSSKSRAGLMQGFRVAIIGKPNVGKSSLLNSLLNYNRAIVSDIAGTTRDTIEEEVRIGTHLIKMVDTAGIRSHENASDDIERIGIERSIEAIESSDIVIALFDSSRECDSEDEEIISLVQKYHDKKEFISIYNKSDLEQKFYHDKIDTDKSLISMSCKEDSLELLSQLEKIMDVKNSSSEMMLISSRQIEAVTKTVVAIEEATFPLDEQELEIFSFHITEGIAAISSITKIFDNEEMLDKMFGSFCLGK
jgi:tRNA modification GTPase